MADQSFGSHTRWFPPFHFFVLPVLLVNVFNAGRHLYLTPARSTGWETLVALALLMLAFVARAQAVTVQDRLIRLEERLRLRQLVPADLQSHVDGITHRQLVAIRFASDAEVAGIVRDIVDGKVSTAKEIKGRVKVWRPDYLRA